MSVFLKNWDQSGIKNVSSLVDEHKKMLSFFSVFPTEIPSKLQLSTILRDFICNTKFLERTVKITNRRTLLLYTNYRKPNV